MKARYLTGAAVLGLAVVTSAASTAQAQQYPPTSSYSFAARRHMDELANRLWQDANSICWEMHHNYRHNPGFRETYAEMYRVMKDAQHVHELVHDDYHLGRHSDDHIARDLHEIDQLFHHIEDDIRGWTSSRRFGHGHYDHHDYGHYVHGHSYSDQLTRQMRRFESSLHHLMADYGVRSQLGEAPAGTSPTAPPAPADGASSYGAPSAGLPGAFPYLSR